MTKFKKSLSVLLMLLVAIILVGCQTSVANRDIAERIETQKNPIITWGVKADTNLFGMYDVDEGEIVGFDIDIAKALTDVMTDGQGTIETVEVTSKTRIPLLKNGNIDAIIATMTISESRLEEVDFSKVYFNGGQSLLVPEDSKIQSIDDMDDSTVVLAIKGSSSTTNFRKAKPEVSVRDLENYAEGFVALQAGQGDALTTDNAILLGMIDQNPNFRLAGENFTREPYGIAINKNQTAFLDEVDIALEEIIANGTYNEIYNKWFGHTLPMEDSTTQLVEVNEYVDKNIRGDGNASIFIDDTIESEDQ